VRLPVLALFGHAEKPDDVRSPAKPDIPPQGRDFRFLTQAVWKRFSSPTQPGAMGLDATV
jgi:hypothetical protein